MDCLDELFGEEPEEKKEEDGIEETWPECEACEIEDIPETKFDSKHEMTLCPDCKELYDQTWGF